MFAGLLCGLLFAWQVQEGEINFTEVNVLCFALVPYYYRLGFMGTPPKKGSSASLKKPEAPPPKPASATRASRGRSKSPARK